MWFKKSEYIKKEIMEGNILSNRNPTKDDTNISEWVCWININENIIWMRDIKTKEWIAFYPSQPERSKREDSRQCEIRCSEHCGNTMREVQ
jgi:hypothetical protein